MITESDFPIWTVVDTNEKSLPKGLVCGGSPGFGPVLPLFTTESGAAHYAESGGKGHAPHLIPDSASLMWIIENTPNPPIRYVAINCSDDSPSVPAEQYILISDIAASFGK